MRARAPGRVASIEEDRPDVQRVVVDTAAGARRAVVYPALTGRAQVGDCVTLNTWAVELGLGTGGVDFVVEIHRADEVSADPPGHIMKLRYTPHQLPVLAAEAQESPHHDAVAGFTSLDTTPVVCAELHSQIAPICAAAKCETRGKARIAYVMTDEAALPIAFSRLVGSLVDRGLIDATVTVGQAFGGNYEAINLYSGLAVARVVARADIIVVSQGPGGAGTGTPLGFSGVGQGVALNAAAALNGTPIAVARLSFADARVRHFGLSHHTVTVLERIAMSPALVPLPRLPDEQRRYLARSIERRELAEAHEFVTVDAEAGLAALADSGVRVQTMGRAPAEDRVFFLAASAAGLLAGQWVERTVGGRPR